MIPKRITLRVEVDMDPLPGWGHEPQDWVDYLLSTLERAAPHYHPMVEVVDE